MKNFKNSFFCTQQKVYQLERFISKPLFDSKNLMFNEFQKLKITITHHFPDNYSATNEIYIYYIYIDIFNLSTFYVISHKTYIILYSYIVFIKIHAL